MSLNQRLVILDPGLNELGGHHPATLESIKSALAGKTNTEIQVYCHQNCSSEFIAQQQTLKIRCVRHFKTPYYRFFYEVASQSELAAYVLELAKEYQQAIMETLDSTSNSMTFLFWCHTLNWEHASALSLALINVGSQISEEQRTRFMVNVGLMYHPLSRAPSDELGRLQHEMRHEVAFRRLAKLDKVRLLAADQEIQSYFKKRFGCHVGIQPCLLLGSIAEYRTKGISNDVTRCSYIARGDALQTSDGVEFNQILLFVGDAKENKGFLELPQLIEQVAAALPKYKFIVQYSNSDVSPIVKNVDKEIRGLERSLSNLELINRFLSHQELMALFQSSHGVVLNYDEITYQFQSSGVLWLAAFFDLRVISLSHTWMSREALRLGVDYFECQSLQECISSLSAHRRSNLEDGHNDKLVRGLDSEEYFYELFTDISDWLGGQFSS